MSDVPDYVQTPKEQQDKPAPVSAPWEVPQPQGGPAPAPFQMPEVASSEPPAPAPPSPAATVPAASTPASEAPAPAPAQAPAQAPAPAPADGSAVPGFIQGTGMDSDMSDPNRRSGGNQASKRLWMPKGSSKTVIFLTEGTGPLPYGPPVLYEHQPPIGQGKRRWQNWHPCLEPLGVPCPLCKWAETHDGTGRRYKGMFFTVLDLSQWTDAQGVTHTMSKKLLVAKKDTKEKIERRYMTRVEAGGGLRGAMFRISRGSSDKSAAVGDDFEFIQMCDLNSIPPEFREPFDLTEVLGLNDPATVKQSVALAVERMKVEAGEATASPQGPQGPATQVSY